MSQPVLVLLTPTNNRRRVTMSTNEAQHGQQNQKHQTSHSSHSSHSNGVHPNHKNEKHFKFVSLQTTNANTTFSDDHTACTITNPNTSTTNTANRIPIKNHTKQPIILYTHKKPSNKKKNSQKIEDKKDTNSPLIMPSMTIVANDPPMHSMTSEQKEFQSPIDLVGSFSDLVPTQSFIRDSNYIDYMQQQQKQKQLNQTTQNELQSNDAKEEDKNSMANVCTNHKKTHRQRHRHHKSRSLSTLFCATAAHDAIQAKNIPIPSSVHIISTCMNQQKHLSSGLKTLNRRAAAPIPTKEDFELVLEHYEIALTKNIEELLLENEPQVITARDSMYSSALINEGITCSSNDYLRLKVIGSVVEYTYFHIEPPNEYTAKTDRKHFKEVAAWSAKFCKDRNISAPITLIIACWFHDIERFIPCTKCKYLPETVDKYRKQVIHPITSAKVALCMLKGSPLSNDELNRIYELILHHDMPTPREDIVILDRLLIGGANDDLMWELQLLMDADSFAFFQSTIYFFILFKSKKNTKQWIWQRVRNNVQRLRPYLRKKAVKCIHKLDENVQDKIEVDYKELFHLCNESEDVIHSKPNSMLSSRNGTNRNSKSDIEN